MSNAKGVQSAPAAWAQYGQGEKLVMLVGLWKALAAQMASGAAHDEPNDHVRELLRALGEPPKDEAPAEAGKDEPQASGGGPE